MVKNHVCCHYLSSEAYVQRPRGPDPAPWKAGISPQLVCPTVLDAKNLLLGGICCLCAWLWRIHCRFNPPGGTSSSPLLQVLLRYEPTEFCQKVECPYRAEEMSEMASRILWRVTE